jgi:DNA phosphorothioation-dependent restriction protein DptG
MTKQPETTEVVKIRLGSSDKIRLQEIAEKEGRTFSSQCRIALNEWLSKRKSWPARSVPEEPPQETAESAPTSTNTGMAAEAAQIAAQIENEIIGAHSNRFVTVDRMLLEKWARQLRHA